MTAIPERVRKRFWSRVQVGDEGECWPFKLSIGSHGYGQIGWGVGDGNRMLLAHRVAWELTVGPIPADLTIDHVCRNRRCCNPNHLRLLTNVENAKDNGNARKTHCPAGHAYSAGNTRTNELGHRWCLACRALRDARKAVG